MALALKASLVLIMGFGSILIFLTVIFSSHGIRSLFLCALEGICSLFAVNLLGLATDITLCVSPLSLCISALLGAPGVVTMLLFNLL